MATEMKQALFREMKHRRSLILIVQRHSLAKEHLPCCWFSIQDHQVPEQGRAGGYGF
jgi:hypothetical protein